MKNINDRILKVLAIIISINLVVYGVASTATTKKKTTKKTSLCFSRMLL